MDGIGFINYQAHSLIYFAIFRSFYLLSKGGIGILEQKLHSNQVEF